MEEEKNNLKRKKEKEKKNKARLPIVLSLH
jgi:hypothetical protein